MSKKISELEKLNLNEITNLDSIPIVNNKKTKQLTLADLKKVTKAFNPSEILLIEDGSILDINKEQYDGKGLIILPSFTGESVGVTLNMPDEDDFAIKLFVVGKAIVIASSTLSALGNERSYFGAIGLPVNEYTVGYSIDTLSSVITPSGFNNDSSRILITTELYSINMGPILGLPSAVYGLFWAHFTDDNYIKKLSNDINNNNNNSSGTNIVNFNMSYFYHGNISWKGGTYIADLSYYNGNSGDNINITYEVYDYSETLITTINHKLDIPNGILSGSGVVNSLSANTWYRLVATASTSIYEIDTPYDIKYSIVFKTNSTNDGIEYIIHSSPRFYINNSSIGVGCASVEYSHGELEPTAVPLMFISSLNSPFGGNDIDMEQLNINTNITETRLLTIPPVFMNFGGNNRISNSRVLKSSGVFGLGTGNFSDSQFDDYTHVYNEYLITYNVENF